MSPKTRLGINLLAVVALGAVMVTWVVTQVVGPGVVGKPLSVSADFEASGGLFSEQEVTYRGVLVGRVGDMSLNEDGVTIEMLIDPEWRGRIPFEVVAKINSKSAVGEQYVNLVPKDSAGDEALAEGDVIARADTRLPVDVQDLFESLENVLGDVDPDETRRLIQTLSGSIGGKDSDIKAILESLATLSKTFADVAPEQQQLLDNAPVAGAAFLDTKDAFTEAITAADEVFDVIGEDPAELQALFEANDELARDGIALLARRGDQLRGGIRSLADFVDFQLAEKETVIQALDYVPGFLHAIEDASIPWESPEGRDFYRIRVGLIVDDVESSWPCKFKLPLEYERFPFERKARRVVTGVQCRKQAAAQRVIVESLIDALKQWQEDGYPDLSESEDGFIWPLEGAITSPYGPRWGRMHTGIDIDGVTGEPVVASAAGTVVFAGYYSGYGNAVILDHGNGFATLYAHLSALDAGAGQVIDQGEILGAVGCTGNCTGDHLHFELRVGDIPVDPLPYLPGGSLFGTPSAPLAVPAPVPLPPAPPTGPPRAPAPPPVEGDKPPKSSDGSATKPADPAPSPDPVPPEVPITPSPMP
ncbi:MAG: MCE family protein [Actinomycetota bacterium]